MGILSPVGIGIEENWSSLLEGRSGIDEITLFDPTDFPVRIAGEVTDYRTEDHFDRKEARRVERFIEFALVASRMAMADAGLTKEGLDGDMCGVLLGTGFGGLATLEETHEILRVRGPGPVSPFNLL